MSCYRASRDALQKPPSVALWRRAYVEGYAGPLADLVVRNRPVPLLLAAMVGLA